MADISVVLVTSGVGGVAAVAVAGVDDDVTSEFCSVLLTQIGVVSVETSAVCNVGVADTSVAGFGDIRCWWCGWCNCSWC